MSRSQADTASAEVAQTVPPLIAASALGALAMAIFESRGLSDLGLQWREGTGRNLATGIVVGVGGAVLLIVPAGVRAGRSMWIPRASAERQPL